jgi:hypothetical protein
MAAHRYWRLMIRRSSGGANAGVGELQMRTSIGGGNVITGGTASASSTFPSGGYTAAKAFDGLTVDTGAGNAWASNGYGATGGGAGMGSYPWIQYDFGAGNEKDIQEIVLFAPGASGMGTADMPLAWKFQYSDDGVTFTTQRDYEADSTTPAWVLSTSRIYDVRPLGAIDINNWVWTQWLDAPGFIAPGQPGFPIYTPGSMDARTGPIDRYSTWCSMRDSLWVNRSTYKIAGSTTVLGFPAPRRVRLYKQSEGRLWDEQYTKPDGLFEFRNLPIGPWTVVGVDDTGTQNGVIFSHVNAVPM